MLDQNSALTLLKNNSSCANLGPFTYDKRAEVTASHPRRGQLAHRFIGKYHRHHFYVFDSADIIFQNDEDDLRLFN